LIRPCHGEKEMGGKSTGREIMTAGIALAILVLSSNVVIPTMLQV